MNARFWIYYKDSVVKLTLRPDEKVSFFEGGLTDEGYSYTTTFYYHRGDHLERVIRTTSSDCDGRFDTCNMHVCDLDALCSCYNEHVDIMYPDWQREHSYQRDYSAEMAGY